MGAVISHPSTWIRVEGTCYELGHTWCESCLYSNLELFSYVYYEALKIYLPLYLISDILRQRHPKHVLTSTIPYALRSSLFLAINASGFIGFLCIVSKICGNRFYKYSTVYIPSFLASVLAILSERKSRRGLLTGYVGAIAVETIYRMLKYRGMIQTVPYGEVAIFSVATAILFSKFKSNASQNDAIGSILKILFSPSIPGLSRLLGGQRLDSNGILIKQVLTFVARTMMVSMWSFAIGYSIQSLLNTLQLGHRIIQDPKRIKQALTKPYNRKFGAFLACLTGFFKVLNAVLFLLSVPRDIRVLIAGLFAGVSMIFIRSTSLSLYAAAKALEILYFKGVSKGYLRSYYYGDVIVYSICTAVLFHAAIFEGHNLRLSYFKFIQRITKNRVLDINYDAVDKFGTDASQLIRIMRAQVQVEKQKATKRSAPSGQHNNDN